MRGAERLDTAGLSSLLYFPALPMFLPADHQRCLDLAGSGARERRRGIAWGDVGY